MLVGRVALAAVAAPPVPQADAQAARPEDPPAPVARSVESGLDAEQHALCVEQLKVATDLLARHPGDEAWFILGAVHNEQGRLVEAIKAWKTGLELPPSQSPLHDRANVLANLGEALRHLDNEVEAEEALRESLRVNPRREATRLSLAGLLLAQNRPEACLALLQGGSASSAASLILRGQACQRLRRDADARGFFETVLRLDPENAQAWYGVLTVCARLGDTAAVASARQRFAALKASEQQRGRSLRQGFSPVQVTRQSVALTHTAAAWVYAADGDTTGAENLWRRAAELDAGDTASRFHLLMLMQKSGRNLEALRLCEEMIRIEPTNAFHQLSLGNVHGRLGASDLAGLAFHRAHELAPQRAETCFALAQYYLKNQTNLVAAVQLARRAAELAPVAPHLYVLSRTLAATGDRPAALVAATRAAELDPGDGRYQSWRRGLESQEAVRAVPSGGDR